MTDRGEAANVDGAGGLIAMWKLCILVNVIAPYRAPLYDRVSVMLETSVLTSGFESNRASWEEMAGRPRRYLAKRSRGLTIALSSRAFGGGSDRRYLHLTPGYLLDLLRLRPDAVISNEMGLRTIVALLYGALLRRPTWVWWGGTPHTERRRSPAKKLFRRVIAGWVKRWISYGESSTEYLLSIGVDRRKILQVQNCVDEELYLRPAEPMLQLEPRPVLLYAGQMIGRKGLDRLLRAAADVQRLGYRFSLLIVGDGPERESLRELARELGVCNTHIHPAQPPDRMPAVYRSADCLVFPTLEDVWGLVVNEALWSGVPVLSSVYAGCAKEILPPENLFDPLDHEDLVRCLRLALDGSVKPADTSRLLRCSEVADLIVNDVKRVLEGGETL